MSIVVFDNLVEGVHGDTWDILSITFTSEIKRVAQNLY